MVSSSMVKSTGTNWKVNKASSGKAKSNKSDISAFTGNALNNMQAIVHFKAKDPVSALTHFIGCIAAIIMTPVLLIRGASFQTSVGNLISLSIFMISMILLYGASASYHSFSLEGKAGLRLKRLDHMMIFVLIAGTYTPICIIALNNMTGTVLLTVIWSVAVVGMLFKLFWVTCPKWVSSVIYIAMGWAVIFAMPALIAAVSTECFVWLLAGGIMYTVGGVIYALKLIRFNTRGSLWGSHEIFHLFVLAGSLCHFICIYNLLTAS